MGKVAMDFHVGEVTVKLIEEGDRICGHIRSGHFFEPQTLAMWGIMCMKGGTVIDVGGYTGLFSIAAAKMGCRVITIEPMPLNAARILENCRLNGVTIELHQSVASDKIGYVELAYNPRVEGLTSGASLVRKSGPKLMVQSLTIDSLHVNPTAMKIDVERGESLVLRGAQATLFQSQPELLVEVLDKEREELVRSEAVNYKVVETLDARNWFMSRC